MSSENALQKQAKQNIDGLANAPLKKKIGFFSAMMIVVGSCVGAGIFFKAKAVLQGSSYCLPLAIFTWLLAGFAVIAMGLALIEISSARNDNLSIIGWTQTFNSKFIYKACKNFMAYIYLPLTYFFMPLYVIMSIQDGIGVLVKNGANFGTSADWAIMMAITIVMSLYFIIVCGLSSKVGNIQNWIITLVKFIPLVLAVVLGFWAFADNHCKLPVGDNDIPVSVDLVVPNITSADKIFSFNNLTPGFGIFIAVGSIFFAYDGFYVAAGIQTEMKEPKKTPLAILFGLGLVTIVYLLIAVAMSLGAKNGNPFGFESWLSEKKLTWLYATFQILIGVGVLGIINGFALWSTRFVEDLISANELPFSTKLVSKIDANKPPMVGIIYNIVLSLPIIVIFCIIGGLAYIDSSDYGDAYGTGMGQLYSFADLMGTWTAVLAFAFIGIVIAGGLKNRRTNEIKVQKSNYFVPMAAISVIIIAIAIFFQFFAPIADVFLLFRIPSNQPGFNDILVSRIMLIVVLVIFLALMIAPIYIENAIDKAKYGSLDNAQIEKAKIMGEIKGKTLKEEILTNLAISKRVKLEKWEQQALGRDTLTDREIRLIQSDDIVPAEFEQAPLKFDANESISIASKNSKTTKAKASSNSKAKSTSAKKSSSTKKPVASKKAKK